MRGRLFQRILSQLIVQERSYRRISDHGSRIRWVLRVSGVGSQGKRVVLEKLLIRAGKLLNVRIMPLHSFGTASNVINTPLPCAQAQLVLLRPASLRAGFRQAAPRGGRRTMGSNILGDEQVRIDFRRIMARSRRECVSRKWRINFKNAEAHAELTKMRIRCGKDRLATGYYGRSLTGGHQVRSIMEPGEFDAVVVNVSFRFVGFWIIWLRSDSIAVDGQLSSSLRVVRR